jgi:hypothetical protein
MFAVTIFGGTEAEAIAAARRRCGWFAADATATAIPGGWHVIIRRTAIVQSPFTRRALAAELPAKAVR